MTIDDDVHPLACLYNKQRRVLDEEEMAIMVRLSIYLIFFCFRTSTWNLVNCSRAIYALPQSINTREPCSAAERPTPQGSPKVSHDHDHEAK